MVRTSFKRGILESVTGSGVSSAAQRIGSAAFFAPEMRTSPSSRSPPTPASMALLMDSGVVISISVPKLVAALEQKQRQRGQAEAENSHDDEARFRCNVGEPEEAVTKAVDHIEEGIEMRQGLPERRKAVDRVEDTGQESERHDQEILKCRELVEFVGRDASDQSQRAQDRAAQQREGERPQGVRQRQWSESSGDQEH